VARRDRPAQVGGRIAPCAPDTKENVLPVNFWKWVISFGAQMLGALLIAVLFDDTEQEEQKPER
jgi:hypothetical protein